MNHVTWSNFTSVDTFLSVTNIVLKSTFVFVSVVVVVVVAFFVSYIVGTFSQTFLCTLVRSGKKLVRTGKKLSQDWIPSDWHQAEVVGHKLCTIKNFSCAKRLSL